MHDIGLSFGSNMGDKAGNIRRAVRELEAAGAVSHLTPSSLYRTEPWGKLDQDWFVNACAVARTALVPLDLLRACLACEARMGRQRIVRWGPRTIDIDLLYYDEVVQGGPELVLPHPEMLNRAFVLVPLMELRPALVIGGTRIADALAKLDTNGIVRLEKG